MDYSFSTLKNPEILSVPLVQYYNCTFILSNLLYFQWSKSNMLVTQEETAVSVWTFNLKPTSWRRGPLMTL